MNVGHGIDPKRNQEFINAIDDIYKAFTDFYNAVVMYGRNIGAKHEENDKNSSINKCVARALNVFRGITILCKTENGTNALILLRNLYEIKMSVQYLRYSDDSVAQRFFDFRDVAWYRYIEKQRGKAFNGKVANDEQYNYLKSRYSAFFKKYSGRKDTWSGKSIFEMIDALPNEIKSDEEEDYTTVYRLASFFVHSNVVATDKIMSEKNMYKVDGDIDNIEGTYPLAIKAIMKIMKIWLEFMEIQLPEDTIDLENVIYKKMVSHFPI